MQVAQARIAAGKQVAGVSRVRISLFHIYQGHGKGDQKGPRQAPQQPQVCAKNFVARA